MATSVIDDRRIRHLGEHREPVGGRYVLHWMQRAQRAEHNDALEHAARLANRCDVPLLVCFALDAGYPSATGRHFRFLLEGLGPTRAALERRGIPMTVRIGHPPDVVVELASDAVAVVTDRAHEPHPAAWRRELASTLDRPLIEVECDVVVPVEVASDRREYAARTIRPKLVDRLDEFLVDLRTTPVDHRLDDVPESDVDPSDVDATLEHLGLPTDREPHVRLEGGTARARAHLRRFIDDGLTGYGDRTPDPLEPRVSHLSPYLHFGQISPVAVGLAVRGSGAPDEDVDAFIEELVVRRELAVNYVHFEADHDRYSALPDWARETLDEHRDDPREVVYTATELEEGRTHDRAWNAAMAEVRETGYLHNHLRMYWGKRILDWTNTPEHAFRTLSELNDRWFLDGRDCSSRANVAWCFGLHDRAFGERDVTGKVRPMTAAGLRRKFDVDGWLDDVRSRLGDDAVDGPGGEALQEDA